MASPHTIQDALRAAVAEGVAPAIGLAVTTPTGHWTWYAGQEGPAPNDPPCGPSTRFDLASLTKPLTTVTWALQLVSAGLLDLCAPLARYLPELGAGPLQGCPVWRLLSHSSGLPAWRPYHEGLRGSIGPGPRGEGARRTIRRMLAHTPLEAAPGARERYSDLGFLMLEWVCERADRPLAQIWEALPGHGPSALHFRPLPQADGGVGYAPTEACPWRRTLLRGEVHDDNTWVMGGVAGHAGLFGTLEATAQAAQAWLGAARGATPLPGIDLELSASVLDARWRHPRGSFALGWDTPTPGGSTSGQCFRRPSMGHLGFTGTSIWMDLGRAVSVVLLTNRVSPSRENTRHRAFRPAIHDLVWGFLADQSPSA